MKRLIPALLSIFLLQFPAMAREIKGLVLSATDSSLLKM